MVHYICKGECKGVSDKPGICMTKECSKHKDTLEECKCNDRKHGKE